MIKISHSKSFPYISEGQAPFISRAPLPTIGESQEVQSSNEVWCQGYLIHSNQASNVGYNKRTEEILKFCHENVGREVETKRLISLTTATLLVLDGSENSSPVQRILLRWKSQKAFISFPSKHSNLIKG